ncbi:MAG: DUF4870 domain-containing protein, partial [Planctomycetes bacterium]|nr:DUF4870 domain-containing protein [Planctomycetota bacterium]
GFLLILALVILHVVTAINGAVHAQNGEPYRYPLAIGFIK